MARPPNVLLIMTDQHAPGVAGFAGDPVVRTQNLDALAREGTYFRNAACTSPICTPSRMSLLTGKDVHHCGAWGNHWVIFPEHITVAQHFGNHGYATSLVGKMHFGGRDQMQGFQRRPYGDLRHGLGHQPEPLSLFPGYNAAQSAGPSEIPESLMQDVVVAREALAQILEQRDIEPDRPWLTVASFGRPHPPLTSPGRYLRHYRGRVPAADPDDMGPDVLEPFARRRYESSRNGLTAEQARYGREAYYAAVDFVDDCIGELLSGLRRTGALDDTIVIYTADHGEMANTYGLWNKTLYFEPSAGVPLVISVPGAGGATIDTPISLMDLFPTLCGLTGLPAPEGLDGVDFSSHIMGGPPPRARIPSTFMTYGNRVGHGITPDGGPGSAWRSIRDKRWKYVEIRDSHPLLFDLVDDPTERINLAEDPEHADRCERMRSQVFDDFSWEGTDQQLHADRLRVEEFLSGLKPTTPNQYMLADGRVFDAEAELYSNRWLTVPAGLTGGVIPQMWG